MVHEVHDEHEDEPPLDYTDDLPESSGSWLDKVFWWGTRNVLPSWLDPTSKFSHWLMELLFVDCAYCLVMRGLTLGFLLGGACVALIFVLALNF